MTDLLTHFKLSCTVGNCDWRVYVSGRKIDSVTFEYLLREHGDYARHLLMAVTGVAVNTETGETREISV